MALPDPILIAGPQRSGTTMLAGLLHHHGVWIGKAEATKAPETNPPLGTENTEIVRFLKQWPGGTPKEFRACIRALVRADGPWLLKAFHILDRVALFESAFPKAKWLLPVRPVADIVDSQVRHPGMPGARKAREKRVLRCLARQQEVTGENLFVDTHAMALKDEDEARKVVSFCGLDFDREAWSAWIEPERWHGTRS